MTDNTTILGKLAQALGRCRRLERDSEQDAHTDIGEAWETINECRDVIRLAIKELVSPVDYVCENCGSSDVSVEAFVTWDTESQSFEVGEVCDKGHTCPECGLVRIKEVPHKPLCIAFEYGSDPATDETLKKAFYFGTQAELVAFREGVQASEGWLEFDITYTDEEQ